MGRKRLLKLALLLDSVGNVEAKEKALKLHKKAGPLDFLSGLMGGVRTPSSKPTPTPKPTEKGRGFEGPSFPAWMADLPPETHSQVLSKKQLEQIPASRLAPPPEPKEDKSPTLNPEEIIFPKRREPINQKLSPQIELVEDLNLIMKLEEMLETIDDEVDSLDNDINSITPNISKFYSKYNVDKKDVNKKLSDLKSTIGESGFRSSLAISQRLSSLKENVNPAKISEAKAILNVELEDIKKKQKQPVYYDPKIMMEDEAYIKSQLEIINKWEKSPYRNVKTSTTRKARMKKIASLHS